MALTCDGLSTVAARKGSQRLEQAIYRPISPCFRTADLDGPALARLIRRELHPRGDTRRLSTILTLPPGLGMTRVLTAKNRDAALEQARGESKRRQCHALWPLDRADAFVVHSIDAELVESAVEAIDAAGYTCEVVLPQPVAVWKTRLLTGDPTASVLDWSSGACLLVTGSGGRIGISRQLPGCNLSDAIRGITGEQISSEQVAAYLRVMAVGNGGKSPGRLASGRRGCEGLLRQLQPFLRRVADEVRRTLDYAARFGPLDRDRLVVSGVGGLLLNQEFEQRAGVAAVPVGDLSRFAVRGDHGSLRMRPTLFHQASALALFGAPSNEPIEERAA